MLARDFIKTVAAHSRLTVPQVMACLKGVRATCHAEIAATGETRIPQLCDIKITPVAERILRNPKTGAEWLEPPSTRVTAKPVPIFARRVKGEK
jgi:nucleoid DNA-binding protein